MDNGRPLMEGHDVQLVIAEHLKGPARERTSEDLLARSLWYGAAVPPGRRDDVRQYSLDNAPGAAQDEGSAPLAALGPGWQLASSDNSVEDWEQIRDDREQERIDKRIAELNLEVETLKAVASPTDDQKARREDIELRIIPELQTSGYLRQVPGTQLFGDDVMCVQRVLSEANIPFKYRHRVTLEQGRPITLFLHRKKPRPEQVNHYLQADIGAKIRVVFQGSDQAYVFRKHEGRDPDEWQAADEERQEILAKRFRSEDQAADIAAKRAEIDQIRAAAKTGHRKRTTEENAKIRTLRDEIKLIQRDHGLTGADKTRLRQLDEFLWRQHPDALQLSNTADGLVGVPFALTMIDSGIGYVVFQLDIGTDTFVWEDKYTVKSGQSAWLWGETPEDVARGVNSTEHITLSGSGGALTWKWGYADVNDGDTLLSEPKYLGDIEIDDIAVDGKWTDILPAGIGPEFFLDYAPDSYGDGWFQYGITFNTDGKYLPLLFRASAIIEAQPSPTPAVVWDSADHDNCAFEVSLRLDDNKLRTAQVTLKSRDGEWLGLPDNLPERVVTLKIDGHNYITNGFIVNEITGPTGKITKAGAAAEVLTFTDVKLELSSSLRLADERRFTSDVIVDGERVNDAVRKCLLAIGWPVAKLAGIPAGQGQRLPEAPVGQKAKIRPAARARVLDFIKSEILGRHGLGDVLWEDGDGVLYITPETGRRRDDLHFKRPGESTDPRQCYAGNGDEDMKRTRNTDKYFTWFHVVGGKNPETKRPYSATRTVPEAVDDRFKADIRYIGHHREYETVTDDSLDSQDAVDTAADTLLARFGFPREAWRISVPYRADLLPGDIFRVSNEWWQLVKGPSEELADDWMTLEIETPGAM